MKKKFLFAFFIIMIIAAIGIVIVAIKQKDDNDNDRSLVTDIKNLAKSIYDFGNTPLSYNDISYSNDNTFYLDDENMYVKDDVGTWRYVDGDFSSMGIWNYPEGTYQSKPNIGGVYFYYKTNDGDVFYTRSENYDDWEKVNLTEEAGVPKYSTVQYIRIYGNYGLIFYTRAGGKGEIITTSSQGKKWEKLNLDFELDRNTQITFLNNFGMCVDGFIRVPSSDGEKCDLYMCNQLGLDDFKKVNVKTNQGVDQSLDYYYMPEYYDDMTIHLKVGRDEADLDTENFVFEPSMKEWITEESYANRKASKLFENNVIEDKRNKMIENLEEKVFVLDIKNYAPDSDKIQISENKAKEIAQIGFTESALRIAGEGTENKKSETIKVEEVYPNNYFTRKSREADYTNFAVKRTAYVITRTNDMGNGVSIFVDATTGLIIGGKAFGD